MKAGNFAVELAEFRVAQERAAQIATVQREVRAIGTAQCGDCAKEISEARRKAVPFATRCVACQTKHEQEMRRTA